MLQLKIISGCTLVIKQLIILLPKQTCMQHNTLKKEQENLRPHSLVHKWKPEDRAEMLTLLAVLILMGIIHKPRLTMYWSKNSILATTNIQSSYGERQISSTSKISLFC